ncbi:MAG: lactonase family protein [Acidobacteriaceae bacterium]
MDHPRMKMQQLFAGARRGTVLGMAAVILSLTGCSGFFVPLCVEYNTCTSTTTTTATTSTTGTTSTTATTGTTATTATTSTTATTGTTATTATTGTTSTTSTTGSPITPSDSSPSFVYVANANNGTIGSFSVDSGKLTSVTKSTVAGPAFPTAIAATPSGKFLYLATSDGAVYLSTIASDGNLKAGNRGNPVANVVQPTWMSMDRTGKWLFVASSIAKDMQEFQIDAATGALHPVRQAPALDPGKPAEVYVTPDNREMFVALGKGGVDALPFDAAAGTVGTRQHIAPLRPGTSGDNALTTDSGSKVLYVGEGNTGIRAFTIGAGATMQEIPGSPFGPGETTPTSLVVDRSNGKLFVANSAAHTMTEYSIADDGALAAVSSASSSIDSSPAALRLDKSGKYVVSTSKNAVPSLVILPSQ